MNTIQCLFIWENIFPPSQKTVTFHFQISYIFHNTTLNCNKFQHTAENYLVKRKNLFSIDLIIKAFNFTGSIYYMVLHKTLHGEPVKKDRLPQNGKTHTYHQSVRRLTHFDSYSLNVKDQSFQMPQLDPKFSLEVSWKNPILPY